VKLNVLSYAIIIYSTDFYQECKGEVFRFLFFSVDFGIVLNFGGVGVQATPLKFLLYAS